MSYDLFFKPRTGEVTAAAFADYFSQRPYYKIEASQAWYQNEDTGVYFVFELQDGAPEHDEEQEQAFPVALNLNYFRPSFFGLEAEPEVTALVRAFDLTVSDPQTNGMGEGEYDAGLFLQGWNHGNEFGYQAILRDRDNKQPVVALPGERLIEAWSWNRRRGQLQDELGESKFVPRIMFLLVEGKLVTAAVWPDGIPIAVPEVDCFVVARRELAPRRFLKRVQDQVIVSRHEVLSTFVKHGTARADGTLVLDYVEAPREIRTLVESLPRDAREIKGVPADAVLDQELVERYAITT